MSQIERTPRPLVVTLISIYFLFAAAYLGTFATLLMVTPGTISLMSGSQFMYGLELAGPYMALLVGCGYGWIGWGLFRLRNWARWLAMLVLAIGIGALVPKISSAEIGLPLLSYGLQIAVRAAGAWYLAQAAAVLDAFARGPVNETMPRIFTDTRD